MGANTSSNLEKDLSAENFAGTDRFYGLVNFGNTCYCNSVLQALYFCQPFRERILAYKQHQRKMGLSNYLIWLVITFLGGQKDNLLFCLSDLFSNIATQKRRVGTIAPKRFVAKLKKDNGLFRKF
jgi:ubiquitin carboxyl-terminal hydrolase 12/46